MIDLEGRGIVLNVETFLGIFVEHGFGGCLEVTLASPTLMLAHPYLHDCQAFGPESRDVH